MAGFGVNKNVCTSKPACFFNQRLFANQPSAFRSLAQRSIRTTISQNLRRPRKFFLVVLVLVLVLDWVSGLDYEDEDDDEDDSVAAAPLRVHSWFFTAKRLA